jgi:hypothetical protein
VEYYDSMTHAALPQALNPNCPSAFAPGPKALLDLLQFMRFSLPYDVLPLYFMTSAERMRILRAEFWTPGQPSGATSQDLRCPHLVLTASPTPDVCRTSSGCRKSSQLANIQTHLDGMRNKPDMASSEQALPLRRCSSESCGGLSSRFRFSAAAASCSMCTKLARQQTESW